MAPVTLDQPAFMLPSGGTTGVPKAVIGAHRGLIASGRQLEAWLASVLMPGADEILNPLPLFHVYSAVGVQGLVILGGRTLTLVPNPRDINQVIDAIVSTRPTLFCGVPTLFQAIMAHKRVQARKVDFSSIRLSFSGAAALMTETRRKWAELTDGAIVEGYSLTEAQMAAIIQPIAGRQAEGEIGLPLPDVDVMLVDPERGVTPVAEGAEGELVIAAPQLMLGYHDQPEETAEVLRTHPDGSRWLYTGDLAVMDAQGYVRLVGRKKDLLKVSGFQVWPTEIEQILSTHPGVREVGVAGLPDPKKGEIAAAWIVRHDGTHVSADDLKAFCRGHLAPYKVPAEIRFVSALPKSAVGKLLRRALPNLTGQA
jgi:long-chain acyl-CoA synthetase